MLNIVEKCWILSKNVMVHPGGDTFKYCHNKVGKISCCCLIQFSPTFATVSFLIFLKFLHICLLSSLKKWYKTTTKYARKTAKKQAMANEGLTKFYESSFSLMNASSSSETEAIQKSQRFQVSECSFSYNRNLSVIHKKHINTGIEKILWWFEVY